MKNIPEEVHQRLENRFLRPLFGLSSDDLLPTPGTVYNDIKLYPMFINKRVVASTPRWPFSLNFGISSRFSYLAKPLRQFWCRAPQSHLLGTKSSNAAWPFASRTEFSTSSSGLYLWASSSSSTIRWFCPQLRATKVLNRLLTELCLLACSLL